MEIIIAGAGKVGFNLARSLSVSHSVTVIDKNPSALKRMQEHMDILPVHGDIEDPLTYRKLINEKADLFIAVTDLDEANIVSTLIADDRIEVERKIIRLRNRFFSGSSIMEKLGVDETVFPLELSSRTVARLLEYPRANNVKRFPYTDLKLISLRIARDIPMEEIEEDGIAVVGIERGKAFLIPETSQRLEAGDLIYLFGDPEKIRRHCARLEEETPWKIRRCVVFGAGDLGVGIARVLLEYGLEVKILDENPEACLRADETLEGEAMAISCKYGTREIFEEENLGEADLMIAATDNDEYNIIKCLEAREHGVRKVLAINNEMEYYKLMHSLGIVVVRGPKMAAYHRILESIHSTRVLLERKYCGGEGTVFLRQVPEGTPLIGRVLKPPRLEEAKLLIVREEEIHRADAGDLTLREGDLISLFIRSDEEAEAERWFDGL
ncbi:NAD-binding protein [Nitratifractor sp.]